MSQPTTSVPTSQGPPNIPLPIRLVISLGIVSMGVCLAVVPQVAFGITTGWLALLMLSLFLAIGMSQGISRDAMLDAICGCAYGLVGGQIFGAFPPPVALLFIVASVFTRLSGKLPRLINDYAFTVLTVYTIPGVANLATCWQDALMYAVGCIVIGVITFVAGKRSQNAVQ